MSVKTTLMFLSLAISACIGLVLSHKTVGSGGGGGGAAGANAQPVIGLSLDTLKEPRWQSDSKLFIEKANSLGAKVLVSSADGDDTHQITDVSSMLTSGIDVLVIVPHNGEAMAKAVEMAHQANVPVIAYDRLIRNCDLDLYLSFDNVKVGRLQAQWLVDHLSPPGHGRIVQVDGSPTDNNAKLFKQGADEVFKPYVDRGDIKIVWEDWADDWKPENGKKIVNAAITQLGPNGFDAVLAAADVVSGGVVQALSEEGLTGKVLVTGQDADIVACQRIIAGTQSMTIYKPLKRLATSSAEIAVKMAHHKPIIASQFVNNGTLDVPSILGDIYSVDKNNMMQTVIADGFHTKDQIYGPGK
jgi:D-xylose transport system substrate-binding protein